ncbi:TatD family deoxyribonuclease [Persicimonas caeni]|uniref:TatD family deoxyribonuclease n=1 Tax=Persicimonas caeni TaxID=2292766 RepID=A0A4Y6Q0H7_PERCE|nr:TatD family hydrolase [Persicimonas caeni]QDG53990.1 TatD family deoxyribonuclease [Persicimonas caeni]QED35211.1 TatD family deoxyribonuclease [Persicimonas caeni]
MPLIDTHAHLDFPKLQDRFDEVLQNARDAGVERIVTIGASRGLDSNYRALDIAKEHDWIRCTAGIHPHDAEQATEEVVETIRREFSEHDQVVGIGETGLDYYYDNAPVEQQKWAFRQFLEMSKEVDKPVIIHSRDADEDTIALLEETGVTGGILHCFTGSRWMAERLFELDFYLSFSGIVTFNSAKELLEIACDTPEDRILVETDSPYLAPVPNRGKTNEPAYVRHTAQKIADARGITLDELESFVWDNAARVFDWT